MLLFFFIIGPTLFGSYLSVILEDPLEPFPWYLNGVYILVGGILIGLAVICIIYIFKKSFSGWFGVFAILVSFYTLFLVLKIYLGGVDTDPEEIGSIWAYIGMIIPDLFIIFYSLSTLLGSQAELLSKRFKKFGLDSVIIWLILSKVAYEFIHYFPYEIFNLFNIPLVNELSTVDNDLINAIKNVAVLIFFIVLIVIIGIFEINKYHKDKKAPKGEEELEVFTFESSPEEEQPIAEEKEIDDGLTPLEDVDSSGSEENSDSVDEEGE